MAQLLPTLEEIQEILETELNTIESEMLRVKKKEQENRDEKRIEELKTNLQSL